MTRRTRAVAAHEAAHAVVGAHAGLTLVRVTLRPTKGALAHCEFEVDDDHRVADGLCTAAGPAWEEIAGPRGRWRGSADRRDLRRMGFSRHDCATLVALARHYLEGPGRVAHELVTRALLERDLTGADVSAILSGDDDDGA